MIKKINKIVIATGGTGGHIFPAYSLAKHFIDKKIDVEIISDKRGLKYLEKNSNIKITRISSSPIPKNNIFKLFISLFIITYSVIRSLLILSFSKPNLVFGMGGYASFPICIAAKILKIPFIIYENNMHIGKANKYLLPFAKKAFVSHAELEGVSNSYSNKVCEIGNIIRKEILFFKQNNNIEKKGEKIRILILGGSQAAKIFAEKLPKIFKECSDSKISLKIYQQCLPSQNNFLTTFYQDLNLDFEIFNFSNNIIEYFSKIDLVITRSGSSMLAELINVKIPFISVPLPTSADNHQLKNAIYYEKNEYSFLIEERDLNKKLFELIKLINKDSSVLDQMKNKQRHYSDKSVYKNIDNELSKIIHEEN